MPDPSELAAAFQPDYTPEQLENLGVYDALYRNQGPRLASLGEWKPEWVSEHDPKGWAQWYKRYSAGRRIPDEDIRQIKRWLSFKARHGGPFSKNPTPRRGWALRNWGIDPAKLVSSDLRNGTVEMLEDYKNKAMQRYVKEKVAEETAANTAVAAAKPTGPALHTLAKPQQFPTVKPTAAPAALTPPPPAFKHPSGALQLGKIQYFTPAQNNSTNTATTATPRASAVVSPGRDSGAGVLRLSQHGGGLGQYNYAAPSPSMYADQYELANPGIDASGRPTTESRIQIGRRAALLNPAATEILPPTKQNFPDADARYIQSQLWNSRRQAALDATLDGPALPADVNPHTLIAKACNGDPAGCTPATYARWLNAERAMHAGYAEQLANLPAAYGDDEFGSKPPAQPAMPTLFDRIKTTLGFASKPAAPPPPTQTDPPLVAPTPPELSPLNLNKVVMVPPGYLGMGTKERIRGVTLPGDLAGSFGNPYSVNKIPDLAAAHEYRLTRGGDPMRDQHWAYTGIYTDARETPMPFIGLADEAKEFGRHIGLSPELGGGDVNSYLDKIRDINDNPDATYWQKVRSNYARPVGSALQFGREVGGLGQDVVAPAVDAARQTEAVNRKVMGPRYVPSYRSSEKAGASVKQAAGPSMPALKSPPVAVSPHKSNLFTATNTQETLGQNIGRWYQNAGGLNNAMNRAQKVQQQNTAAGAINRTKFPAWDVNKVNTTVPIKTYGRATNLWNMPGADGQFSPTQIRMSVSHSDPNYAANSKTMMETAENFYLHDKEPNSKAIDPGLNYEKIPAHIELRGGLSDAQAVKEHELTHAATIPGVAALHKADAAAATNNRIAYPDQPTEVDVRLAEIKRRYAHHTGKLVDSPEEAQKAWEWWRQNQNQLQTQRPEDKPTMDAEFFKRYDEYPTDRRQELFHRMPELVQQQNNAFKFGMVLGKQADLLPEVNLQPHQERIQDTVDDENPRMIVYHGLGSGKSLSALAAAEAAKKKYNEDYGIVAPASLRGNFQKEVEKFTENSSPEILSYTGLGMGKKFSKPPETVIMDEAHRLRNPGGAAAQAAADVANQAKRVLLLTGSPITNSPSDLANLISIVARKNISPQEFEKKYIGYKTVHPGLLNWAMGIKPGVKPVVKNEGELKNLLQGHVDYQPSKTPEGVNVNEEKITVPLSAPQQKIQKALRTQIPPSFLWKLDQEFPLSKDELSKLNSFLTGLRQNSVSTRPFRSDNDAYKSFLQSGKLQEAYGKLKELLDSDPRKKAIIYSNHIGAGVEPYAAALAKHNIPHGIFHGGVPTRERQKALADYNAGKLRALLIGPAGAEGLSTKGTNLIQLLDPHWHESRSQQAQGRGLRFDSHDDLPEELKNVHVQRFISRSEDPSWLGKLLGYRRERTGDEILERLSNEKEKINERFRDLLREVGTQNQQKSAAYEFGKLAGQAAKCSCGCGQNVSACSCLPSCSCRQKGGSCYETKKEAGSPAWQRSEGKNEEGGLNAKGRASYNKATGGHLKAPVTEKNPTGKAKARRHSFCSRMCGMKSKNTGSKAKSDPDSRINKSLRKWNCKCSSAAEFGAKCAGEQLPPERAKALDAFVKFITPSRKFAQPPVQPKPAVTPPPAPHTLGKASGFRWYKRFPMTENLALNMSLAGPSITVKKIIPGTSMTFGNRAPRMYIGTPLPGVAYQQYISHKKHKIKAEKDFKDAPEDKEDSRTTFEKIKDFLFGSDYGPDSE